MLLALRVKAQLRKVAFIKPAPFSNTSVGTKSYRARPMPEDDSVLAIRTLLLVNCERDVGTSLDSNVVFST